MSRVGRKMAVLSAAVAGVVAGSTLSTPAVVGAAPPPVGTAAANQTRAAQLIRGMTLEEKIGQLFVTIMYGESADHPSPEYVKSNQREFGVDTAAQLVSKYHLGGILYSEKRGNSQNPKQLATLSNGLQKAALGSGGLIPLMISADQEYGTVVRIYDPVTQFPGQMAIGAGRSTKNARDQAKVAGLELRALGVNEDNAPDADVNDNPKNPVINVRSYGGDSALVSGMVSAAVRGFQAPHGVPYLTGVSAAAKHFPGHGNAESDSHLGLPVIHRTAAQWREIDAKPFKAAIAAGIDTIMTAHIVVPSLDPAGDPATLSKPIMTDILRKELKFDGVITTDALDMQGVRTKYGDARVPVLALKAGVDQLLMPPDFRLAYNAVLAAVRNGELTEKRIDESVRRILLKKLKRGAFVSPYVNASRAESLVGTPANRAVATRIADRSTTLVANPKKALPLAPDGNVLVTGWQGTLATQQPIKALTKALTDAGRTTVAKPTGAAPTDADIAGAVTAAKSASATVVLTRSSTATLAPEQVKLVRALTATGKPVVAVAVQNPYDVAYATDAGASLATYSYTTVAMRALAKALTGKMRTTGKLPVAVPSVTAAGTLYPFGHGL